MTEAVKNRSDALVLTTETASGKFPFTAVQKMNAVLPKSEEQHHKRDRRRVFEEIPPIVSVVTIFFRNRESWRTLAMAIN